jgi:hypothetical protein
MKKVAREDFKCDMGMFDGSDSFGWDGDKLDSRETPAFVKTNDSNLNLYDRFAYRRGDDPFGDCSNTPGGDCSAFNAGFAHALRAFGVPARVSLGFKYGRAIKQACESNVAPHAETEFFVDGVGWIPCDATMGLRRLGHDGLANLSFVEWRPAVLGVEEAEELDRVISGGPTERVALASARLEHILDASVEGRGSSIASCEKALATGLGQSGLTSHGQADQVAAEVLRLLQASSRPPYSARQLSRAVAAFELGKFQELGTGPGLPATSKAGVKFYEGGPYEGRPLPLETLHENMIVPDDMDRVLGALGAQQGAPDWSQLWPYGVFRCSYEFEEQPLP